MEFVWAILNLKKDQCLHICIFLYKWWDVRNKANVGEPVPSSMDVVCAISHMFRDISEDENKPTCLPTPRRLWKPPDENSLKINFDAGFRKKDGVRTCGFVVRDHLGEAVLAGAMKVKPIRDALSAEAVACLFVLESTEAVGISRIKLETDCSQLQDAIMSQSRDLAPGGVLFRSIRELLQDRFICNKIIAIPCSCNSSAHKIAKLALSWDC
jgi:ribonuclease HI